MNNDELRVPEPADSVPAPTKRAWQPPALEEVDYSTTEAGVGGPIYDGPYVYSGAP